MSLRPRPEVLRLKRAVHGGPDYAELAALGLRPEEVVDFSANTHPFGPPAGVAPALAGLGRTIERYPDSEVGELRGRLGERLGVSPTRILCGNGSAELLWLAALAYLQPGAPVLILGPTFGEYRVVAAIAGAAAVEHRTWEEDGFVPDIAGALEAAQRLRPQALFLCNPNNPTGQHLGREAVAQLAAALPDALVVVDEAYASLMEHPPCSLGLLDRGNVLLVRSLTKDYALAGLRLGYALGREDLIATLRQVQPPWSVNAAAQAAGLAALADAGYMEGVRRRLAEAKTYLLEGLTALGLVCQPSAAPFFLVKVGDAPTWRRQLLQRGMLVRDCSSFGLPQHIRLSPRSLEDCRRLLAALKEIRR
ncbi:MAG: histidinol-phosphate aminotransferase family protein [Chloroflexi bacterium]|nr:histidinol-phosphate aminotransferase family protein [Chloroflexota bacterium]